ncbi:MAG TPA: hypothetical protein VLA51_11970, partial [Paracoccaceae bacterium]|nr:hypothetical protein [Paracoccaceae bacterium]
GRVLMTGKSGINPEKGFVFDVGAVWKGTSENAGGDFALPTKDLQAGFVGDPLFMYVPAELVEIIDGVSMGEVFEPYFDRTPRHFSGHVNAPSKPDASGYSAGSVKGNFTYFAFPIFSAYHKVGAVAMLEIAENLVASALSSPRSVSTTLPRAGRVIVRQQAEQNRDIVHLLYATPVLRGTTRNSPVQPIQDLTTINGIDIDVAPTGKVASVKLVPEGEALAFEVVEDRLKFTVPRLRGHQMVEIGYE